MYKNVIVKCQCSDVCRFELGAGLYMGWAGAFLAILGGGMLCCACKRVTPAGSTG